VTPKSKSNIKNPAWLDQI